MRCGIQHRLGLGKMSVDYHGLPGAGAGLIAFNFEHNFAGFSGGVVGPQAAGNPGGLAGSQDRDRGSQCNMNPRWVTPFNLINFFIYQLQIVDVGSLAGAYLDVDFLLVIARRTHIDDGGTDGQAIDHKLTLIRPILNIRVNRPHLVNTGFTGKRREGETEVALIIGKYRFFALKTVGIDNQIEGYTRQGKTAVAFNRPAGDDNIFITHGACRRNIRHLAVIGGIRQYYLAGGDQALHGHRIRLPQMVMDAVDFQLDRCLIRRAERHRNLHRP